MQVGYFHEQPGPEQTTSKAFGFKDRIPRPHSTYSYFRKQISVMVVFHNANESKTGKSFVPSVYSKQTVVPSFIFFWSDPFRGLVTLQQSVLLHAFNIGSWPCNSFKPLGQLP